LLEGTTRLCHRLPDSLPQGVRRNLISNILKRQPHSRHRSCRSTLRSERNGDLAIEDLLECLLILASSGAWRWPPSIAWASRTRFFATEEYLEPHAGPTSALRQCHRYDHDAAGTGSRTVLFGEVGLLTSLADKTSCVTMDASASLRAASNALSPGAGVVAQVSAENAARLYPSKRRLALQSRIPRRNCQTRPIGGVFAKFGKWFASAGSKSTLRQNRTKAFTRGNQPACPAANKGPC